MRRFRWLLPVAIFAIVIAVASIYIERKESLAEAAPNRPHPLEEGVQGRAIDWCYTQSEGDHPRVDICAAKLNESGGVKQLEGAQIKLYHDDAKKYDLVESDLVRFYETEKKLYSEGDVKITLAVPVNATGGARLLSIHSSGVEFATDTAKVFTERAVSFEFEQGGGSAVGAFYDPSARELRLNSNVVLDWRGKKPGTEPLHIESGEAWYFEKESKVVFNSAARLERAGLTMESDSSEVLLDDGAIRRADLRNGRGVQKSPGRSVDFGADQMFLNFTDRMAVETINAEHNAHLVSTTDATRTTVNSNRLDLTFHTVEKDSALDVAVASGKSSVEAAPVARKGVEPADTRVLRSDVVRLFMRAGGKDIDRVVTDGAGTVDFLPNRPDQPKRALSGDRIWIDYGEQNRVRQFRSTNASTRTERPKAPPMTTSAKEIIAAFDPRTNELARLEHNTDFQYTEGESRASADRAVLEQLTGVITLTGKAAATDGKGSMSANNLVMNRETGVVTLDGAARANDPSGSVVADHIVMNRKTGDMVAEGRVTTTRQPDGKGQSSAMLSNQEVMQATARRMTSSEDNSKLHYEGDAKAWQGANRIEGDRIDIDRKLRVLEAHGNVMTQFADRAPAPAKNGKRTAAVFTVVHAPDLIYTEANREARYSNGVLLERPNVTVNSRDLVAYLSSASENTSLERAVATGTVKIHSQTTDAKGKRTRDGTAERGEYFTADQKVHLSGGRPTLVDNITGSTEGDELTWWADNDRLLVNGTPQSVIRKK